MDFYHPSRAVVTAADGSLQFGPPPYCAHVSLRDYESINKKSTTLNNVATVFAQQLRRSIPNCSAACTLALTSHFPTLASLIEFARNCGSKQAFVNFVGNLERGDDSAAATAAAQAALLGSEEAAVAALFIQAGAKKRQKLGPQFARFLYTLLAEEW
jgi:hypothetical protein